MADPIKIGTILIEGSTPVPESMKLESEPFSNGWRSIKSLNGSGLDRKIREAGWAFFSFAQIKASVFGFDRVNAAGRAVSRLLANVKSNGFNALEIGPVAAKYFLGLHYVTVSGRVRHVQESIFLLNDKRLAKRNEARLLYSRADRVG